jgi:Flp pilus assembly protein TadG
LIARKARWVRDETGQIVVLTALLLTVLLFAVGIAFDLGTLFVAKRTLQEAVDAAAYAGSIALYNNLGGPAAVTAAQTDFNMNGYNTGDANIVAASTWWESPPLHTPWSALSDAAQHIDIQITYNVRVPLLPAEGGVIPVTVRSTAKAIRQSAGYAIVALNAGATPQSFYMAAGATVNINNGDVHVNSTCNGTAGACSNNYAADKCCGTFSLGASSTARVVGGAHLTGAGCASPCGFAVGQWLTGATAIADPLAGYVRPSITGMTDRGAVAITTGNCAVSCSLNPGYYSSLTITGPVAFSCTGVNSPIAVTFNPGTYVLKSGMSATWCVNLSGTGVTFFNTDANYPNTPRGACAAFNTAQLGSYIISAPTSGYYFGMHIFQDSYCTNTVQLAGTGTITTNNGTIYASTAQVSLLTANTLTIGGHLIADKIFFGSVSTVNFNYDPTTAANPLLPGLVQ